MDPETLREALRRHPSFSDRSIAALTGADPHTVARYRAVLSDHAKDAARCEASGRRARGRQPSVRYFREHWGDGAMLYRAYDKSDQLLYITTSLAFMRRVAVPWLHEIDHGSFTRYDDMASAEQAERAAILGERPKYNIVRHSKYEVAVKTVTPPREVTPYSSSADEQVTPGMIRRPTGRVKV